MGTYRHKKTYNMNPYKRKAGGSKFMMSGKIKFGGGGWGTGGVGAGMGSKPPASEDKPKQTKIEGMLNRHFKKITRQNVKV